jgi:Tfp pilus assembly protein PilN
VRAVNLLPPDESKRTKTNVPALVGVSGAVLATGVVGMLFLSASAKVHDRQNQLDAIQAQIAVIPPPPPPDVAGQGLAAQEQARLTAVSAALTRRVAWDRILRNLSLVLPDDVWLTQLAASAPASSASADPVTPPSPTAQPTQFTIGGYTYTQASVARLLSRLELLPDLTNVQLLSSVVTQLGKQNVVQFTLAANIRTGASS